MKKIILIPDSFKGNMSSAEVCREMEIAILRHYPRARIISVPVADGGEGSVDCFLEAVGGQKIKTVVKGPFFEDMESFYGLLPDGTAVIEMAAAAGLPLVEGNLAADKTTTYGVGQLIASAAESGAKKIIVGLDGSATNDGGCGAAAAIGVRFYRGDGEIFVPTGGTLQDITDIDLSGKLPCLSDVQMITMCDIDNPLCGPSGAAHVFGPQKGADPDMVKELDAGLARMATVIKEKLGKDIIDLPGAGAAGGMGAGMVAFMGSRLQMGIETVLDTVGFDGMLEGTDLVFSGEGKLDTQSLRGKVVIGVARRSKKAGVPVIAVVGDIGDNVEPAFDMGVSAIFSTNRVAIPYAQARLRARSDLALTMDNIIRFSTLFDKRG